MQFCFELLNVAGYFCWHLSLTVLLITRIKTSSGEKLEIHDFLLHLLEPYYKQLELDEQCKYLLESLLEIFIRPRCFNNLLKDLNFASFLIKIPQFAVLIRKLQLKKDKKSIICIAEIRSSWKNKKPFDLNQGNLRRRVRLKWWVFYLIRVRIWRFQSFQAQTFMSLKVSTFLINSSSQITFLHA